MPNDPLHLSQIDTPWKLVREAHESGAAAGTARELLLRRYSPAVLAFLTRITKNREAGDELYQEFAVRLLQGGFERATIEKGRFRDYLKSSLRHLVVDYRRRENGGPQRYLQDIVDRTDVADPASDDAEFDGVWRDDLLARAWRQLEELQRSSDQPWHTVLRLRVDHPDWNSTMLASEAATLSNRSISQAGARKLLQRAREMFTDLLIGEVSGYLDSPARDVLEQELIEVGLYEWCKSGLDRRFGLK